MYFSLRVLCVCPCICLHLFFVPYVVGCIWQPQINEYDDDDDDVSRYCQAQWTTDCLELSRQRLHHSLPCQSSTCLENPRSTRPDQQHLSFHRASRLQHIDEMLSVRWPSESNLRSLEGCVWGVAACHWLSSVYLRGCMPCVRGNLSLKGIVSAVDSGCWIQQRQLVLGIRAVSTRRGNIKSITWLSVEKFTRTTAA